MSLTLEQVEKRIEEIPNLISRLNAEYNQLLGYKEGLKSVENSKKDNKKDKN
jgi:tetrahydromethanopterin S-methyltransferase subunit G|tara:strand:+ start:209 stop:364 length:156 start_codon:yes stop_codon:yes gene_type:complete